VLIIAVEKDALRRFLGSISLFPSFFQVVQISKEKHSLVRTDTPDDERAGRCDEDK